MRKGHTVIFIIIGREDNQIRLNRIITKLGHLI